MNIEKMELFSMATFFAVLSAISNYAWLNLWMMTNMLTPPTKLTAEQAQAVNVQGQVIIWGILATVGMYAFIILYVFILPYLIYLTSRYKVVVEEQPDGTPDDTARTPPAQL